MGQSVTWLVPHQVSQLIPEDVDWTVLTTFLEFYETMLLFVNFKLYHSLSVCVGLFSFLPPDRTSVMASGEWELLFVVG